MDPETNTPPHLNLWAGAHSEAADVLLLHAALCLFRVQKRLAIVTVVLSDTGTVTGAHQLTTEPADMPHCGQRLAQGSEGLRLVCTITGIKHFVRPCLFAVDHHFEHGLDVVEVRHGHAL